MVRPIQELQVDGRTVYAVGGHMRATREEAEAYRRRLVAINRRTALLKQQLRELGIDPDA